MMYHYTNFGYKRFQQTHTEILRLRCEQDFWKDPVIVYTFTPHTHTFL